MQNIEAATPPLYAELAATAGARGRAMPNPYFLPPRFGRSA